MALIERETDGAIAFITLARPEVRNALSSHVIRELNEVCEQLKNDQKTRAVVITGAGDKAFSAGADLKERLGMSEKETLSFVADIQKTFQRIATLPMPTIAAINGDAFGGGLELALACDLRVISEHASLGLTECSLGIIPGAGGTQRLPRLIGLSPAMDLIFSARRIGALEALSLRLVNYVAENADMTRSCAREMAMRIAENAPLAVRSAKEAIMASLEKNLSDGLVAELASYHAILETEDRKEGLRAFKEKRAPRFLGA